MIAENQLLILPPYKAVAGSLGSGPSWNFDTNITPFVSKSWTGVPLSSHPLLTPILWHTGTWLANYRNADPEGTSLGVNLHRQYGSGITNKDTLVRAPVSIVINGRFTNYFTEVDGSGDSIIAGIMNGFTDQLNKHNVFVGILTSTPTLQDPFAQAFPSAAQVADPKPFSAGWQKRTYNSSQWKAGKILSLGNVQVNITLIGGGGTGPNDGAQAFCPFYQVQVFPNVGVTTWQIQDDTSVAYYSGQADTLSAQTALLKQVTYVTTQSYQAGASVAQIANYTAALNLIKAKIDTFPTPIWHDIKKYYFFNGFSNPNDPDTDLTSLLTADVAAFLGSL